MGIVQLRKQCRMTRFTIGLEYPISHYDRRSCVSTTIVVVRCVIYCVAVRTEICIRERRKWSLWGELLLLFFRWFIKELSCCCLLLGWPFWLSQKPNWLDEILVIFGIIRIRLILLVRISCSTNPLHLTSIVAIVTTREHLFLPKRIGLFGVLIMFQTLRIAGWINFRVLLNGTLLNWPDHPLMLVLLL